MHSITLYYVILIITSLITSMVANTTTFNCGQSISKLLLLNGQTTSSEFMPWNAAVYANENNIYSLRCGATLIAPNLVISIAFCFGVYEQVGYSSNVVKNINQYKIAVGKYNRYISIMDHKLTQIVDVETVYIKEEFTGKVDSFTNDIAVVKLSSSVRLGDGVMPVCIDWSSQHRVRKGVIGKISGWTRTNIINESFVKSMPYIDRRTCLHMYTTSFINLITKDKFCAGSNSDQDIGIGGGAGLTFLHNGSYYLTGIYSVKNQEIKDSVAVFSDVRYHSKWIYDIYFSHTNTSWKVSEPNTDNRQNCKISQFLCNSGRCIDPEFMCDGINNCQDGSDENPTICKTKINHNDSVTTTINPIVNSQSTAIEIISPPSIKKMCVVKNTEGVIYSYKQNDLGKNDELPPGTNVEPYKLVYEHCKEGYYKTKGYDTYIFKMCSTTGNWEPHYDTTLCLKMCPPMSSNNLELRCTFNNEDNDCSKPSAPNTKLKPRCKPLHILPNGRVEMPVELSCLSDGRWSGELYRCVPDCGRIPKKPNTLIANGKTTNPTSVPWNVAVYHNEHITHNNRSYYKLICGGTLITPNLVVSAAHCFEDDNGEYKMAVGKYTRDISIKDDISTQIIDVKLIYKEPDFNGRHNDYISDISVIVLSTNVNINQNVLPVCVDWLSKYSVQNDSTGKIAGWGNTEKNEPSSVLLEAELQYIDRLTCKKMFTTGYEKFISRDKFCAKSKSGQGVNNGDSGAGLCFVFSDSYFLTGITSLKPTDDIGDSVAAFTDVRYHINWISNIYNEHVDTNMLKN